MDYTTIPDIPKDASELDCFGINKYENGLRKFLFNTNTPITIALQGEWGSGKTSLMLSLQNRLCCNEISHDRPYIGIWINTWEYALLSTPEKMLYAILKAIIGKIIKITSPRRESVDKVHRFFTSIAKAAVRTGLSMVSGDGGGADDIFDSDEESNLAMLRNELETMILEYLALKPKCKGFMFFIDDLDRINPSVAVELLEVMKNIFTINYCVFILAIDYEVVVKGLKPKFGERTDKNEREFRSFFDKIIQVPFAMPVDQYITGDFVIDKLSELGYLDRSESEPYNDHIKEITFLTVGNNPRSIKRLLNTISLVNCIFRGDDNSLLNDPKNRFINLIFVSLLVSYPRFYSLLSVHPDFTSWSAKELRLNNIKNLKEDEKSALNEQYGQYADEKWEQTIQQICEPDPFLKKNFFNISRIFNILMEHVSLIGIIENRNERGEIIRKIDVSLIRSLMSLSAATSIDVENRSFTDHDKKDFMEIIHKKLIPYLTDIDSQDIKAKRNTGKGGFYINISHSRKFDVTFDLSFIEGQYLLKIINGAYIDETSNFVTQRDAKGEIEFGPVKRYKEIIQKIIGSHPGTIKQDDVGIQTEYIGSNITTKPRVVKIIFPNLETFTTKDMLTTIANIVKAGLNMHKECWKLKNK